MAALILGYDTWAIFTGKETMTSAFARGLKHPLARWAVTLAWLLTTLHLYERLPKLYDPFHGLTHVIGGVRTLTVRNDRNVVVQVSVSGLPAG